MRADKLHERLVAVGVHRRRAHDPAGGGEGQGTLAGRARRQYRPWITEPGLWLQFDWGWGPRVPGPGGGTRETLLFCAWLAWSRFRVVIPVWDRKLGTLLACLDTTLRRVGGVPTYGLTDNERTVTVDHVAGVPVRHPMIVSAGRHYGIPGPHLCAVRS